MGREGGEMELADLEAGGWVIGKRWVGRFTHRTLLTQIRLRIC